MSTAQERTERRAEEQKAARRRKMEADAYRIKAQYDLAYAEVIELGFDQQGMKHWAQALTQANAAFNQHFMNCQAEEMVPRANKQWYEVAMKQFLTEATKQVWHLADENTQQAVDLINFFLAQMSLPEFEQTHKTLVKKLQAEQYSDLVASKSEQFFPRLGQDSPRDLLICMSVHEGDQDTKLALDVLRAMQERNQSTGNKHSQDLRALAEAFEVDEERYDALIALALSEEQLESILAFLQNGSQISLKKLITDKFLPLLPALFRAWDKKKRAQAMGDRLNLSALIVQLFNTMNSDQQRAVMRKLSKKELQEASSD